MTSGINVVAVVFESAEKPAPVILTSGINVVVLSSDECVVAVVLRIDSVVVSVVFNCEDDAVAVCMSCCEVVPVVLTSGISAVAVLFESIGEVVLVELICGDKVVPVYVDVSSLCISCNDVVAVVLKLISEAVLLVLPSVTNTEDVLESIVDDTVKMVVMSTEGVGAVVLSSIAVVPFTPGNTVVAVTLKPAKADVPVLPSSDIVVMSIVSAVGFLAVVTSILGPVTVPNEVTSSSVVLSVGNVVSVPSIKKHVCIRFHSYI